MVRAAEPLEQEVKKIEIRRNQEQKKPGIEAELIFARHAEAHQVNKLKNEIK